MVLKKLHTTHSFSHDVVSQYALVTDPIVELHYFLTKFRLFLFYWNACVGKFTSEYFPFFYEGTYISTTALLTYTELAFWGKKKLGHSSIDIAQLTATERHCYRHNIQYCWQQQGYSRGSNCAHQSGLSFTCSFCIYALCNYDDVDMFETFRFLTTLYGKM